MTQISLIAGTRLLSRWRKEKRSERLPLHMKKISSMNLRQKKEIFGGQYRFFQKSRVNHSCCNSHEWAVTSLSSELSLKLAHTLLLIMHCAWPQYDCKHTCDMVAVLACDLQMTAVSKRWLGTSDWCTLCWSYWWNINTSLHIVGTWCKQSRKINSMCSTWNKNNTLGKLFHA